MAFWQRKNGLYVFVYTSVEGKQKSLPRSQTKHLDGMDDSRIEAWVQNYTMAFEKPRINPDSINYTDSNLNKLIDNFAKFRISRKLNKSMVNGQTNLLKEYAVPFFLMQSPPLKDPNQWPGASTRLLAYLEDKEVPPYSIVKLNIALRKFYHWLEEEGVVVSDRKLRLRNPVIDEAKTPLEIAFTPDQMLRIIDNAEDEDFKIIMLLGYFFSLRPFEIFGVRKSDFAAGDKAQFLECCQTMKRHGQFNRLAVKIERQRRANGEEDDPKTVESKAWAACFDKRAAELMVKLANKRDGEYLITEYLPDHYIKKWRTNGIKNSVIKDLRRSSLLHLGHKTDFGLYPISLMHHARHTKIETTLKYCRRPEEKREAELVLTLE